MANEDSQAPSLTPSVDVPRIIPHIILIALHGDHNEAIIDKVLPHTRKVRDDGSIDGFHIVTDLGGIANTRVLKDLGSTDTSCQDDALTGIFPIEFPILDEFYIGGRSAIEVDVGDRGSDLHMPRAHHDNGEGVSAISMCFEVYIDWRSG